uniref:Peptidase M12B domain-containing protein n=1 Tax=Periophthalmus magnuspinnatus TaxID=409849 RepID=A0A3B3ZIA8_9GOBI
MNTELIKHSIGTRHISPLTQTLNQHFKFVFQSQQKKQNCLSVTAAVRLVILNSLSTTVDLFVVVTRVFPQYYKPLNIRVMLVHLEVFKDSNPFSVEGAPGEVLGRFAKWRRENLNPRTRNDVGHGRPGAYGNVLGMAFVGTVCSLASSAGINVVSSNSTLSYFSTIVAHEIGHNLGMNHDRDGCVCDGNCIMGIFSDDAASVWSRQIKTLGQVC